MIDKLTFHHVPFYSNNFEGLISVTNRTGILSDCPKFIPYTAGGFFTCQVSYRNSISFRN